SKAARPRAPRPTSTRTANRSSPRWGPRSAGDADGYAPARGVAATSRRRPVLANASSQDAGPATTLTTARIFGTYSREIAGNAPRSASSQNVAPGRPASARSTRPSHALYAASDSGQSP